MSDTPLTKHLNKDTQGVGPFRRRDIVRLVSIREGRLGAFNYEKYLNKTGEVSAVHDDYQICSVLMEDGYYHDFYFDEIISTGEKGTRFPEIHYVPCDLFGK